MNRLESIIGAIGSLLFIAVALLFWQWSAFAEYRIRSDLDDYASVVRKAEIPLVDKERLLDCIEAAEDHMEQVESLGYFEWRRFDATVREMLQGSIQGDEIQLLERTLKRVEKKALANES